MLDETPRIIPLGEVIARTSLSRPTIYRRVSREEFPAPIKLGANRVGWLEHEVSEWILARCDETRAKSA